MGGSSPPPSANALPPYEQQTSSVDMPEWKRSLMGFNEDSPYYSPYRFLSRYAGDQAKVLEGMTTHPNAEAARQFFGVEEGTDLTPYLQAFKTGTAPPPSSGTGVPMSAAGYYVPNYKPYAKGGLMSLRKFADGDAVTANTPPTVPGIGSDYWTTAAPSPTNAELRRIKRQEAAAARKVKQQEAAAAKKAKAEQEKLYGGITSPIWKRAIDELGAVSEAPPTIAEGAGYMSDATKQLLANAGYTPEMIDAAALQGTAAEMGPYEKVAPEDVEAAAIDRGSVRELQADQMGPYEQMLAAQMGPYQNVAAQRADVTNAISAAINRGDISTANALMANVASMNAPTGVQATTYAPSTYQAALMQAPEDISAQGYTAAQAGVNQMAGPKSWTDTGTAGKYMSPYMQNVVDIQKREANRDYQRQLNQLQSQAVGAKAYGGSRLAIERAEAARNQQQKLADIEAQGLQQAYTQGMGQFSAEEGLGLQAGQANLSAAQQTALANQQALNNERSQYVNNALAAAQTNYGGKLTAAQQNQIAQNAAAQFNATQGNQQASQYATQQLQAAQNNYSGQLTAAQQNQAAQNAAYNNYAAQQLQAMLANQGMDYNTALQNAQFAQQTGLTNAAASNTAANNYAAQQLQALLANQQAGLTTEQQNAQMLQQAGLANQQAGLTTEQQNARLRQEAGLANQQMDYNTALQNAQFLQTAYGLTAQQALQAALANQQAGLTVGQQNAAYQQQMNLANQNVGLNAAIQNQQAGLTGQGLNLQALNQAGAMGQGLGNLGNTTWNTSMNIPQMWGGAFNTAQGIAERAANAGTANAQMLWNAPNSLYNNVNTMVGGATGQVGTTTTNRLPTA